MDTTDCLRQMRSVAADPFSKGRNFVNHYAIPEWNVVPVSPTIETQYSTVIGTGIAQARAKTDAISIVNGGDAGTAEGDFLLAALAGLGAWELFRLARGAGAPA